MARSVPLSRFTSRVGGGSAFYVSPLHTFMKNIIIAGIMAVSVLLVGCGKVNSSSESSTVPPNAQPNIGFNGVDPQQVLDVYRALSALELISDSRVKSVHNPIVLHSSGLSSSEIATSIEKALTEQAGIVITRLGDKKVSVTYNDSLPIKNAK
jgi:hypothetical protein